MLECLKPWLACVTRVSHDVTQNEISYIVSNDHHSVHCFCGGPLSPPVFLKEKKSKFY